MCAGTVRVARPTESGCALALWAVEAEPSESRASITTVRAASQAMRRAVSGWIGPTPPNSAGVASAPERRVSAPTVTVRWGRCPCTSRWSPQRSCRGKIDQRVGTSLRGGPGFSTTHPVTERIDRGLHQRAALRIELATQDEDAAIGLVALEPAALVGVVGIGEHAVGIQA